jgi:hypothetical protein
MLSYQSPRVGDVRSLKNWIENSSSLATEETAYLSKPDLLGVESPSDDPLIQAELLLEKVVVLCYGIFKKVKVLRLSELLYFSTVILSLP